MSIKWFICLLCLILTMLTLVAVLMTPNPVARSKVQLSWVTDLNPQRDPQVETFNRLYPSCLLSIDPDNNDITKIMVQYSVGMGSDLIDFITENNIQTYIDAGMLKDVTADAQARGFGLDTLPPTVRPLVTAKIMTKDDRIEERQFCYPCNVAYFYIFYNKNIFDRYGVPYPPHDLTWTKYIELARKLTIYPSGDKNIPEIFGAAGMIPNVAIFEKGGSFFNTDGTVCTIASPAFVDGLTFYHRLLYRDNVEPSPLQRTGISSHGGYNSGYTNWFGEGKVAMLWGARHTLINLRRFISEQKRVRDEWLRNNPGAKLSEGPQILRYGCVMVPRFADGPRYTAFAARCTGVNAQSKNRDAALNFMQFLAGAEYSKLINDGADGNPGNAAYNRLELFRNPVFPDEEDAHRLALESIPFARTADRSPYVNNNVVTRIFSKVTSRLVADRDMTRATIEELLREAADEINLEIARNIKRNPDNASFYRKALKQGAKPIKYDLNQIH